MKDGKTTFPSTIPSLKCVFSVEQWRSIFSSRMLPRDGGRSISIFSDWKAFGMKYGSEIWARATLPLALMELVFNTRGADVYAKGRSLKTKWICLGLGRAANTTISIIGIALQKIYYSLQPSNYKSRAGKITVEEKNYRLLRRPSQRQIFASIGKSKKKNRRQSIENKHFEELRFN